MEPLLNFSIFIDTIVQCYNKKLPSIPELKQELSYNILEQIADDYNSLSPKKMIVSLQKESTPKIYSGIITFDKYRDAIIKNREQSNLLESLKPLLKSYYKKYHIDEEKVKDIFNAFLTYDTNIALEQKTSLSKLSKTTFTEFTIGILIQVACLGDNQKQFSGYLYLIQEMERHIQTGNFNNDVTFPFEDYNKLKKEIKLISHSNEHHSEQLIDLTSQNYYLKKENNKLLSKNFELAVEQKETRKNNIVLEDRIASLNDNMEIQKEDHSNQILHLKQHVKNKDNEFDRQKESWRCEHEKMKLGYDKLMEDLEKAKLKITDLLTQKTKLEELSLTLKKDYLKLSKINNSLSIASKSEKEEVKLINSTLNELLVENRILSEELEEHNKRAKNKETTSTPQEIWGRVEDKKIHVSNGIVFSPLTNDFNFKSGDRVIFTPSVQQPLRAKEIKSLSYGEQKSFTGKIITNNSIYSSHGETFKFDILSHELKKGELVSFKRHTIFPYIAIDVLKNNN